MTLTVLVIAFDMLPIALKVVEKFGYGLQFQFEFVSWNNIKIVHAKVIALMDVSTAQILFAIVRFVLSYDSLFMTHGEFMNRHYEGTYEYIQGIGIQRRLEHLHRPK